MIVVLMVGKMSSPRTHRVFVLGVIVIATYHEIASKQRIVGNVVGFHTIASTCNIIIVTLRLSRRAHQVKVDLVDSATVVK